MIRLETQVRIGRRIEDVFAYVAEAVIDGQMVSARAWPDHSAWMREFVRLLREQAPVEPVAQAIG